jgi:hypothetical protein
VIDPMGVAVFCAVGTAQGGRHVWQYMQRRSGERTIRKLIDCDPGAAAEVLKAQAAERAARHP